MSCSGENLIRARAFRIVISKMVGPIFFDFFFLIFFSWPILSSASYGVRDLAAYRHPHPPFSRSAYDRGQNKTAEGVDQSRPTFFVLGAETKTCVTKPRWMPVRGFTCVRT